MVLLHVITSEQKQASEILNLLLDEKLILEAIIHEQIVVAKKNNKGTLENETQTMIVAKTKALLFNKIETILRERYSNQIPVVYSTPIVDMDAQHSKELITKTAKV